MVYFIGGLPGSGKTFVAKALAQHLNIPHLSSDQTRSELNLMDRYDPESKQKVYDTLLNKCLEFPFEKSFILDSTFTKAVVRDQFIRQLKKAGFAIHPIWVYATESVVKERTSKTRMDSKADYRVYLKLKDNCEDWPFEHVRFDTSHCPSSEEILKTLAL